MQLTNLKKIIPALLLAATVLSLLPIGVPAARAQQQVDPNVVGGQNVNTGTGAASAAPVPGGTDDTSCFGGGGIAVCVSNLIYFIMVGVFSSIAYVCAFFFDLAVQLSLNSTTYALGFLTTSWEIVRDLSNMAFIFILIYVAITVMLTADNSQTIKTLAIVVVVALLVNFSFFFTRVAIDAGNLLALQFYNAIEGHAIGSSAGSGLDSTLSGGSTNATNWASGFTAIASAGETKDLTASIMDGLQVQNLVNSESFKRYRESPGNSAMYTLITLSTIYIAVGIAFGILAGSFLYAGAKFMMRIVGLWFVIIFSPLALVAAALPGDGPKKLFRKWLNHLINFSFYPAAFLFMFFVLSRFMKELNQGGNFLSGVFAPTATTSGLTGSFVDILSAIANVGVRLGFVVAMMYLALSAADILATSRGDITSGRARQWAGWMGNMITGGAFGVTGRTAVRVGNFVSGGRLGGKDLTFDPRNIPGVRNTIAPLLRGYEPVTKAPYEKYGATPIDFGKGYVDKKREKEKERLEKAKENIALKKTEAELAAEEKGESSGTSAATAPKAPQQAPTPHAAIPVAHPPATPPTQSAGGNSNQANTIQASNLGKILQELNKENVKNIKETVNTSVSKSIEKAESEKTVSLDKATLSKMTRMMSRVVDEKNGGPTKFGSSSQSPQQSKGSQGTLPQIPPVANDNSTPNNNKTT